MPTTSGVLPDLTSQPTCASAEISDASALGISVHEDGPDALTLRFAERGGARRGGVLAAIIARAFNLPCRSRGLASVSGLTISHYDLGVPLTDSGRARLDDLIAWGANASLADLYERRGPVAREPRWSHLGAESPSEVLKRWAVAHYEAAGITDDWSVGVLRCGHARYTLVAPAAVRVRRRSMEHVQANDRETVEAYAELLRQGVAFPPLVLRARGYLQEGYHRLAAHLLVATPAVAVIEIGRATP